MKGVFKKWGLKFCSLIIMKYIMIEQNDINSTAGFHELIIIYIFTNAPGLVN